MVKKRKRKSKVYSKFNPHSRSRSVKVKKQILFWRPKTVEHYRFYFIMFFSHFKFQLFNFGEGFEETFPLYKSLLFGKLKEKVFFFFLDLRSYFASILCVDVRYETAVLFDYLTLSSRIMWLSCMGDSLTFTLNFRISQPY